MSILPERCPNCEGHNYTVMVCKTKGRSNSIADGRLFMHDVQVIFALGCEECSETLKTTDSLGAAVEWAVAGATLDS